MRPFAAQAIAAIALLLISACGGGGGSSSSPTTTPTPSDPLTEYRQALGGEPLNLSQGQIVTAMQGRVRVADRFLATDVLGSFSRRSPTACDRASCTFFGSTVTLDDVSWDGHYDALMMRDGVSVAAITESVPNVDGTSEYSLSLGAWAEHQAFGVALETAVDANNVATGFIAYGISIGNDTGSNPVSGSARWDGVMVGFDTVNVAAMQGSSTLTVDFAARNVDVAFTNIHSVGLAEDDVLLTSNQSIYWNDVPLTSSGFYAPGIAAGDKIEGTFYGPGHAEAGGVFEHGDIVGAFGATRQ